MSFRPPPATACWQHLEARSGFEVAYFQNLADGWAVDGTTAAVEDGQTWVVESSAMTNTLPVHCLVLAEGGHAGAPAAYVRALDLSVARLEQAYRRIADDGFRQRYDYAAPAFGFTSQLVYDESGLVLDYPGIARRAG
jgi:uncharacterized protein